MSHIVVSTWRFGLSSNQPAWEILKSGGSALDAVVRGVEVAECDPAVKSVGFGGYPNAEGEVEVDAAVIARVPSARPFQMAYIAIDKYGNWGAAAARSGFLSAVTSNTENQLYKSRYFIGYGGVG